MFLVACACSDPDCAVTGELIVADLAEAEHAVCDDCACTLVVLGVAGHEAVTARVTLALAAAA
jgi:hypothetical protein